MRRPLIFTAVIVLVAQTGSAACPHLAQPFEWPGGNRISTAVAVGDFTDDGKTDLIRTTQQSGPIPPQIQVIRGNGDETFQGGEASAIHTTAIFAADFAARDFNRDGKLDLVLVGGNQAGIFFGNGNGTFVTPPATYTTGTNAVAVAMADFFRDGHADLAIANQGSNNLTILVGSETGAFTPTTSATVSVAPTGLQAGDFNRDSRQDVAVLHNDRLSILLGNGDGTFASPVTYDAGQSRSLAVADVNGDGKLDLVTANPSENAVALLLGQGDGTFAARVTFPASTAPTQVLLHDFDTDGTLDIGVASTSTNSVSILRGSQGSFAAPVSFNSNVGPLEAATGDFDRDGRVDLALVGGSFGITTMLNRAHCPANCGTFRAQTSLGTFPGVRAVSAGDINKDGRPDLVMANDDGTFSVSQGGSGDTFMPPTHFTAGQAVFGGVIGDFDRDGNPDIAVTNAPSDINGAVVIFWGDGTGAFAAGPVKTVGRSPLALAVADFDVDGRLDLVTANYDSANISVVAGADQGTLGDVTHYAAQNGPVAVTPGDFNGDGRLDLVVVNFLSDSVSILLANGTGTFAAATHLPVPQAPTSSAAGDFNRDGKLDLAVTNHDLSGVAILIGSGTGAFSAAVPYSTGPDPDSVAVADLNQDGKLDLAVANQGADNVSILLGNGDGTFQSAVNQAAGDGSYRLVAASRNGTAPPFLVTANKISNDISILATHCPWADYSVTKTHTGNFSQGQIDATYTITVASHGTLDRPPRVTDVVPAGLTARSIGGQNWICGQQTLTCFFSPNSDFGLHPLFVTVVVPSNATPGTYINTATVTVSGDVNPDNDTASDPTNVVASPLAAPSNLIATASSTSQVDLTWDLSENATSYQVSRSTDNSAWSVIGNPTTTNFTDTNVTEDNTYIYEVQAVNATAMSGAGLKDIATTVMFTDDPIVPAFTPIKAVHLTELRRAVGAFYRAAGRGEPSFAGGTIAPGTVVSSSHVSEIHFMAVVSRIFIQNLRPSFIAPDAFTGAIIRARQVQQTRDAVK